jgi:hypothetical protein
MFERREFLKGSAAAAAIQFSLSGSALAATGPVVTPERFGAKGDGKTDDSAAFAALSDHINAAGGGTVVLRRTVYRVGGEHVDSDGRITPAKLMEFVGCSGPLIIRGNGARLRCNDGLRYGMFGADGAPLAERPASRTVVGLARPYTAMILVRDCSGAIDISQLELDGNLAALRVAQQRGKGGWQIACNGLMLRENKGPESIADVFSHDHAEDGFYIDGIDRPTPGVIRTLKGLRAAGNARQGMSIVGGHDYAISDCAFTTTGRGQISTSPGAGVDIEGERSKHIRNLVFTNCRFSDNAGCGMVADSGETSDVIFTRCTFIGTTNWSAWPRKPRFRFYSCNFVGTLMGGMGDPNPEIATQFYDCTFRDDPALSPTHSAKLRKNLIADLPFATNVLFERCSFIMTHDGVLPWSVGPIYSNCIMSQRSPQAAQTHGTFRGTNRITGPVNIGGSAIEGVLILNGQVVPPRAARKKAATSI